MSNHYQGTETPYILFESVPIRCESSVDLGIHILGPFILLFLVPLGNRIKP